MRHSAIYAGTFDPLTLGHVDLVERASRIFDRVIVAVVARSRKSTMFTVAQRVEMTRSTLDGFRNVEVESFDGLLVEYARAKKIHVLLRGIRAFSDFEYEFQMALTNRTLAPEIETVFLMPQESFSYISSSTVREILDHGGDASPFVPATVLAFLARNARAARPPVAGAREGAR